MSKITKTIAALGVVAGLGVAALPLASYAVDPDVENITVKAAIGETLTLTVNSNEVSLNPTNGGAIVNTEQAGTIAAKVVTNVTTGYNLVLADTDTEYALVSGEDKIPAGVPKTGTSAWGVKGGLIDTYKAMGADGLTLANQAEPTTTDGVTTNIDFAVSAASNQAAGTYTDALTLTATANS